MDVHGTRVLAARYLQSPREWNTVPPNTWIESSWALAWLVINVAYQWTRCRHSGN